MAKLSKLNVNEIARELTRPFAMANLARVGDVLVSLYICEGMLGWHKHVDHDELFWTCEGSIILETERGKVALRPGELAVVQKGIRHRSGAVRRAVVLLLRCGFVPHRKNGRRRLYATPDDPAPVRVDLNREVRASDAPFTFRTAVFVEEMAVQVGHGEGTWQVEVPAPDDLGLYVLDGNATVRSSESIVHLHQGDLTAVPEGAVYHLSTTRGTSLVRITRPAQQAPRSDEVRGANGG
jgi:mannose-6-phosphate isomerase-like protein (cupin superfamily)